MIDFMEFRRETTRFRRGAQYLETKRRRNNNQKYAGLFGHLFILTRVAASDPGSVSNAASATDLLGDFEDAEESQGS